MSSFLPFLVLGWNLARALAAFLHNEANLEMESLSRESETPYWPWSNFLKFCKKEINFCLIEASVLGHFLSFVVEPNLN